MVGKGVKTSGWSFYGFKQWWAALVEATSPAPSSGRHKYSSCTAQTHENSPSATAAASPSSPKPPLSSQSRRKREDSAECSKFKCLTFFFFHFFFLFSPRLQYVWRYCPSSKSLVLRTDGAQGTRGGQRAFRSLSRRGKQLMLSLELFSPPAPSQW